MLALIDADIITYRIGFTTQNDPVGIAFARADDLLDSILLDTQANSFELYLSDSKDNNFRYEIFPDYKGQRPPKPIHYDSLKEHMIVKWGAKIAYGQEADDMLGIRQMQEIRADRDPEDANDVPSYSVICSIDKDLKQIPGQHYNFVKKEWALVTVEEGLRFFYQQLLQGDGTDNIDGCQSIGPIKAKKILDGVKTEAEMLQRVLETYRKKHPEISPQDLLPLLSMRGALLKIRQQEDEPPWSIPMSLLTEDYWQKFMQSTPGVNTPSTAATTPETASGTLPAGQPVATD